MRAMFMLFAMVIPAGGQQDPPQAPTPYANSYRGKAPPEITGAKKFWLNSPAAVSLKKLKGRPVLLVFTTLW